MEEMERKKKQAFDDMLTGKTNNEDLASMFKGFYSKAKDSMG